MADEFETTIRSFPELEELTSSDIFYSVSKVDTVDTDFRVNAQAIKNFIIGSTQISNVDIDVDTVISMIDNNTSRLCNIGDFEKYLFGSESVVLHETVNFRVFKEDGSRGFVSIEDIFKYVNVDEDIVESLTQDISTASVRLFMEDDRISMNIQSFRDWIIGPSTFTEIKDTNLFSMISGDDRGLVPFSKMVSTILPPRRIISDDEVTTNLRIYATSGERGYITLGTVYDFILGALDLPKYDNGDDSVNENVVIPYYQADSSGKMSVDALYSILFKDSITELTDETTIRASDGVILFSTIKEDIYNSISETFKIGVDDLQSDINDGDMLLFVENNDNTGKHNGISFNTVKEKILDFDNYISVDNIDEFDRICIIKDDGSKGHILYKDLRDKLQLDLYGAIG